MAARWPCACAATGHVLVQQLACPCATTGLCLRRRRLCLHHRVQAEHELWLTHVNDLAGHPKAKVTTRLSRQPGNRALMVDLYQILPKDSPGTSLVAGTWKRQDPDTREEEIVAVDLRFVLSALDGMEGSPFVDQMDRWAAWAAPRWGECLKARLLWPDWWVFAHLHFSCHKPKTPPPPPPPLLLAGLQADGCLRWDRGRAAGQGRPHRAAGGQPHKLQGV